VRRFDAVILAAGLGTRMRSATPKALHDLCGQPMILWPLHAAREAGAEQVLVVDSPARALSEALPDDVHVAVQEQPDGTGGAAAAALAQMRADDLLDAARPVVILSADVPLVPAAVIAELVAAHLEDGNEATVLSTVLADPAGYGRIVRDGDGRLQRIVETKTPGDSTQAEREICEINTGIFAFSPGALERTLPALDTENAQKELYLPQVIDLLAGDGAVVGAHAVEDEAVVLGVNDRAGLARVRAHAQRLIAERHMAAGVGIVDPSATVIDVDVEIGQDTLIEPFTSIRGKCRIGAGCTIRHSYLRDCVLEDGASVGPFAYLRPGTVLRRGSKIGTFVELKASDVGEGAKIPHLSYIGDATIGERANLGASTVTANYDGLTGRKDRTTIGARAKTGVDTTLVAPVTLGADAYTGAGSVITDDVPDGALGIARERQRNIPDYASREGQET
jgi:bifunctional UDP-N-acetylglucosamine pyrophosphorylase/glucosamine-1-phosphate N-acetyltransferase